MDSRAAPVRIVLVTALVVCGLAAAPGAASAWRAFDLLREVDDIHGMAARPDGTIFYTVGADSVTRLAPFLRLLDADAGP